MPQQAAEGRRVLAGFLVSFQEDTYGNYWPLFEGENLVGRAETSVKCDVAITHGTTSTRHASLRITDASMVLADMKSTNGTYLNGRRLAPSEESAISDGDKVRFGGYTTSFISVAGRK